MVKKILNLQKILIVCAIILISMPVIGTATASANYILAGKITNQNQEPIAGVTAVFVCDGIGGSFTTVTDDLGNYVLHPYAGRSGTLTLSKVGYRIIRDTFGGKGEGTQNIWNYTLSPDWISGKITNQNGEPLQGVKITFEQDGGLSGVQTIFTDENGNYRYTVPVNATYWMTVTKDGYQTNRDQWSLYGGRILDFRLK